MYRKLTTLFTTLVCGAAFAASPRVSLTVDTNGLLLAPTNFFQANAARIADMVSAASGVANTNSIWPAAGSNVSASTNGNIVTISADVSTASVTAAVQAGTNTLNSSLTTRITNATNDLNTALSSRILGATNALGSAAYQSASAFDASGAATAATNGITSPFLVSKLGFQPATNGVAQTNFPYTAITNSPWLQSASPTFTGTLTGPAVTVQSASSVATLRLAGDSGTGGATRDIQSTPSGIVFENFQFANGTINGDISSTELGFLDGLTANIQDQINALASTNGGSATNVFFADTATISHSTSGTSNTFSLIAGTTINNTATNATALGGVDSANFSTTAQGDARWLPTNAPYAAGGFTSTNSGYDEFGINNTKDVGIDAYGGHNRQRVGLGKGYVQLLPGGGQFTNTDNILSYYLSMNGYDLESGYVEKFPRFNGWEINTGHRGAVSVGQPWSSFSRWQGGSAASLDALPPIGNEFAAAMTAPPIIITTWHTSSPMMNEANTTNMVWNATTNGFLAALTNAGVQPWLHLDSNARWLYGTRVSNRLQTNSVAFPSGTNLLNTLHAAGWKVGLTLYMTAVPDLNTLVDLTGNEGGPGANYTPSVTPFSIRPDVSSCYEWGFDWLRASDTSGALGAANFFTLEISDAVLHPTQPGQTFTRAFTDGVNLGRTVRPLALSYLTPTISSGPLSIYSRGNLIQHDAMTGPITISGTASTAAVVMNAFRNQIAYEIPYLREGFGSGVTILDDISVPLTRISLSAALIGLGQIQLGWPTNSTMDASLPNLKADLSNTTFLSLMADRTHYLPVQLFDNGPTNTSGFYRKLNGGAMAVALFNEGASISNAVVTWSKLNLPDGNYNAFDVWGGTNLGMYSSTFTNAVPAGGASLIYLTPTNTLTTTSNALYSITVASTNDLAASLENPTNFASVYLGFDAQSNTNYPVSLALTGTNVVSLTLTNDLTPYFTNRPAYRVGWAQREIIGGTTNYTLRVSTNYHNMSTNLFTVSGAYWTTTIASNQVYWLSVQSTTNVDARTAWGFSR